MFLNKSNLTEAMQITIKIALIVLAITTIGLAPSIAFNQPAKAASHWCENQGKTSEWANGCKQGWSIMIIATNMNQIKVRQLTLLMDIRWDGRKDTAISN